MDFTPEKITSLKEDEVFVFGSNLAGQHQGGAARVARERFGAIMGQGVGLQGQSYAIPTMQGGVESIRPYVDDFIEYATCQTVKTFLVTKIGCGIAGFSVSDIAPLFARALDKYQIVLPKEFVEELHSKRYSKSYLSDWSKRYTSYDMTIDSLLTLNRLYKYTSKDCETAIKGLRECLASPIRSIVNPITWNLHIENTTPTLENIEEFSSNSKEALGKRNDINPLQAPYIRYQIVLIKEVANLLLEIANWERTDRRIGFATPGDFYYTLFSLMSGRWNCGDNSYLDDNLQAAFPIMEEYIRDKWPDFIENGLFDEAKAITLLSQPELWETWREKASHNKALYNTIERILDYESWDKKGEYYLSDDDRYFYPRKNLSRPVFSTETGRIHFPNFPLKKAFINGLKPSKTY